MELDPAPALATPGWGLFLELQDQDPCQIEIGALSKQSQSRTGQKKAGREGRPQSVSEILARCTCQGFTKSTHARMAPMLHPNFTCPLPKPRASMICSQEQPPVSSMVKLRPGRRPGGRLVSKTPSPSTRAKRLRPGSLV